MMTHSSPRILIVDDESLARERLRHLLDDLSGELPLEIAGEAADGSSAVLVAQQNPPDIVLLDIQMPGPSGLETARCLARLPRAPELIFVTAFDNYAVKAFEVEATDYLTKPVRSERLKTALERAMRRRELREQPGEGASRGLASAPQPVARQHLPVHERGRVILVPIDEVLYLKAELKYVTIRTAEREYLTEESLVSLEEEFGNRFIRIHRNALVASSAIEGFDRGSVSEGGWLVRVRGVTEKLPVSRRQWAQIRHLAKASTH